VERDVVTNFTFDDLAKFCPGHDIERFRDNFNVMFDYGPVCSQTIGFDFSLGDNDPERLTQFEEMVKLFRPISIWAGTVKLQEQLNALKRRSILVPFCEGGGFMVVLKIPFLNKRED
jgi:hypothetical protein